MLATAPAALQRQRAALRHEQLGDGDVLAARGGHAHGVPGVDDLVVGLRHQAQPPVDRRLAVVAVDGDGQHVPVRVVDAGGERPAAADDEPAVGLARRGRRRARSTRRSAHPGWRPTPRAGSRGRSSRGSSDGRRGCRRSRPSTGSRARARRGCRPPPRSRAPCRRTPWADGSGTAPSRAAAARCRGSAMRASSACCARSRRIGTISRARRMASS